MNRPAISEPGAGRRLARALACHGLAGLCALGAMAVICAARPAYAQAASAAKPAPAMPAAGLTVAALQAPAQAANGAAPASPRSFSHEQLFSLARNWVEKDQQVPAEQLQFAALDSRVRIADCSAALQFDYPFSSSRETVRVRCTQPAAWQLFLRLTGPIAAQPLAPNPNNPNLVVRANAPVTAQVASKTVVVTRQLLQRGTELSASMLEQVQRPALGLDPLAIGSLKDVDRAELVRDIPAGTVLRSYDIKRSLMVRRGQSALLTVGQGAGFQVTVRVEAEQDGYLGEQIRLKNAESGRLISGVVTGPNAVKGL
ncbi:MAG: flagellar basal body P-ring formation chaperone FlgA [Betaproteobacteria bacterium]